MPASQTTVRTVVISHSGYGHTQRMAEAVAEGAAATLVMNVPVDSSSLACATRTIAIAPPVTSGDRSGCSDQLRCTQGTRS